MAPECVTVRRNWPGISWTHCALFLALVVCFCSMRSVSATIVRFNTSLGDIDVRLFDTATPNSVTNFLNYAHDDDYDQSFIHRMPNAFDDHGELGTFVVQGGGFKYTASEGLAVVPTDPPVQNEPGISNLKYTLSYAKMGGDPDSADSGFFFNSQDNANNLDAQNGGFTVFGRIVRGFDVLDDIAALTAYDVDRDEGDLFDNVPLLDTMGAFEDILVFVNDVNPLVFPDGDYNFDGVVNLSDYTLWRDTLGSTSQVGADGNGNGVVDAADYGVWSSSLGQSSTSLGDYNRDGLVNLADYSVWRDSMGSVTNLAADGNGNDIVDSGDYTVWKANFGNATVASAGSLASKLAVPEPSSLWLALAALWLLRPHKKRASNEPDTR